MLRKLIWGAVGTALLGSLVVGREAVSYVRAGCKSVRQAVKAEVPLEFEIQRAQSLVDQLVPEVHHCMRVIAEEEVNVEDLNEEVRRTEESLAHQKQEILALRKDLGSGNSTFKYAGRVYAPEEVRRDLAERFNRFQTVEQTLSHRRQVLAARESALNAARAKLDAMLIAKQDLALEIENLDARLKTLRAAETASNIAIDHSQLSRAKQLIRELNKQLDVKEKLLDAEGRMTGLIPVLQSENVPEDLNSQIDKYFGDEAPATPEAKSL